MKNDKIYILDKKDDKKNHFHQIKLFYLNLTKY